MVRIHVPEIGPEALADRIRDGARRGGAGAPQSLPQAVQAAGPGAPAGGQPPPRPEVPQLVLQPEFRPRGDDQYHVNDLLQYHDRDFIQNAYRAILKRYPDAGGFEQFLSELRSGRLNKLDVLARLRFSPEGRVKKVRLKGLLLPAAVRRVYGLPVVGYLVRWAVGLARLPRMIRHQQQLESHLLAQQQMMADYSNDRARELSLALGRLSELRQESAGLRELLSRLADEQAAALEELRVRLEELRAHLGERLSELSAQAEAALRSENAERREEIAQSAQGLRLLLEEGSERLARELTEKIEQLARGLGELDERTEQSSRKEQEIRAEVAAQARSITLLLEAARSRQPSALFTEGRRRDSTEEGGRGLDAFYVSFENLFRGSRAEIKERFRVYLPVIKDGGIGSDETPVLDIGCGRGEWLELLQESGLRARGVDANRVHVADCRRRGLDVIEAHLPSYLRGLPAESVGAVTGFHVAEHLPTETLVEVVDEAVRVLKPGGVLIFETPNPHNVLVGSYYFHLDLTHHKPLPSPAMRFLFEARGLSRVEVIELHPAEAEKVEGDSDLVRRFNEYFYGPMDYAVAGWKV